MQELNLRTLADRALRGWKTSAALAILFVLYMLVTLPMQRPVYSVSMTVVPTPNDQSAMPSNSGGLSSLLSLTGGGGGSNSTYVRYQKLLTSPVVAQRMEDRHGMLRYVFASSWDKDEKKWVARPNLHAMLVGWLLRLAHVPTWSPPDATTLADFLAGRLLIVPSTQTDIVTITMNDSDPQFAKRVMLAAHEEANGVLSDQLASHAKQQVDYLESKLAQTTVADYRGTLLQILSTQQKTLMLTQTSTSYAAEVLSPPVASPTPISPRPVLSVVIAAVAGIIMGMMITILFGPLWWRDALSLAGRLRDGAVSARGRMSQSPLK